MGKHLKSNSSKKIAIIGTRGIPNRYGGFEYFAQHLGLGLEAKGYKVTVPHPKHLHSKTDNFGTIQRLAITVCSWLPHSIQKLQYSLKSLRTVKRLKCDAIICCGYAPAIFFPWFNKSFRSKLVVNMDGLEWKRNKWGPMGKAFLKLSERIATKWAGSLVADNPEIYQFLKKRYRVESNVIAYGADWIEPIDFNPLIKKGFSVQKFGIVVARLEPENQTELIIEAFVKKGKTLVIVGGLNTKYGRKLYKKYATNSRIIFWDEEYHEPTVQWLRCNSVLYVHGHTVGGTNPSLLQAMMAGCKVLAHDNKYNRATLQQTGHYFENGDELETLVDSLWNSENSFGKLAQQRVQKHYSWEQVVNDYIIMMNQLPAIPLRNLK